MTVNFSPLAQTFKIPESFDQGVFLTSVDLFFAYVAPSETNPVEIQIVETLNGYPTASIIPHSKVVVRPKNISYSANGKTPTKFKFSNLVYLESGVEYALKVTSNSLKYKVWTAIMGQRRVDNPSVTVTQQPAIGSLFKSQNNSTWTPEQLQDLTFRLNRAKFNTNVIGNVSLVEPPILNTIYLPPNPFKIVKNVSDVKVYHPNHGFAAGMLVEYSGSEVSSFNTSFTIKSISDSDHYVIVTADNHSGLATEFEWVGGDSVLVESGIKFDTVKIRGVSEGRDVGTKVTARFSSDTTVDGNITDVVVDEYTDLAVNKYVHTSINRRNFLSGGQSFRLNMSLSSVNDAVSPVIDLGRIRVNLISNRINNPSSADVNYELDGETVVTGASNISFTASTISVPSTTEYYRIKEGAWIKIVGGTNNGKTGYISKIDTDANTLTIVGDTLSVVSNESANIVQYDTFISETSNGGTAESKYITKKVNLLNKATGLRILVKMNIHTFANIDLYYRTGMQNDSILLDKTGWTKSDITYKKSSNEFEMSEYEFNITNLDKFDEFQIKFVFRSSSTAVTPKIQALRVIAHA